MKLPDICVCFRCENFSGFGAAAAVADGFESADDGSCDGCGRFAPSWPLSSPVELQNRWVAQGVQRICHSSADAVIDDAFHLCINQNYSN